MATIYQFREQFLSDLADRRAMAEGDALATLQRALKHLGAAAVEVVGPNSEGLAMRDLRLLDEGGAEIPNREPDAHYPLERIYIDDTPGDRPAISRRREDARFAPLVLRVAANTLRELVRHATPGFWRETVPVQGDPVIEPTKPLLGRSACQIAAPVFLSFREFAPENRAAYDAAVRAAEDHAGRLNAQALPEVMAKIKASRLEVPLHRLSNGSWMALETSFVRENGHVLRRSDMTVGVHRVNAGELQLRTHLSPDSPNLLAVEVAEHLADRSEMEAARMRLTVHADGRPEFQIVTPSPVEPQPDTPSL